MDAALFNLDLLEENEWLDDTHARKISFEKKMRD
jgi:hypothetical protein